MKMNNLFQFFAKGGDDRIDKLVKNPHSFEISEDGIEVSSSNSSTFVKWNSINNILEISSYFLIHPSPLKFFILPINSFKNENQLNDFLKLISDKIDKRNLNLNNDRTSNQNFSSEKSIVSETQKLDNKKPLFELTYSLSKIDFILLEFINSNHKKIIFSLIPFWCTLIYLFGYVLFLFGINPFGLDEKVLLIGAGLFLIFTPLTILTFNIYYKMVPTENSYFHKMDYSCTFYPDSSVINRSGNIDSIGWNDLIGDKKELDTNGFYFLDTTLSTALIPKKVFEGKENELGIWNKIISQ
jgi:hypothetical protein